jgi:hypothetical protein
MAASGIAPFRAWQHVIAGRVQVDGRPVLDPRTLVDPTSRLALVSGAGHVRPDVGEGPSPWLGPRGPQRDAPMVTDGTPAVALGIR